MYIKKTVLTILVLSLCFCLSGCKEEYGEIKDPVKTLSAEEAVAQGIDVTSSQFTPSKNTIGYEFNTINIGRAFLSLPYPKGWTVDKISDYYIRFTAPGSDPLLPGSIIYFHSTLETEISAESIHVLPKQIFYERIASDRFYFERSTVSYDGGSDVDESIVNTDISKPELQLHISYRDYDASVYTAGGSYPSGAYHQTTAFYWCKIPCALTGLSHNQNADALNELLLYIMSNSSYIRDEVAKTEKVSAFRGKNQLSFELCPIYKEKTITNSSGLFEDGVLYACPPTSGTGFSHSAIGILRIKKEDWSEISPIDKDSQTLIDAILKEYFGSVYNQSTVYGFIDDETGGSATFGDKNAKEYIYRFTFDNVPKKEKPTIFNGQSWALGLYPVSNGDNIDVFYVISPRTGLIWSMEALQLISDTVNLK